LNFQKTFTRKISRRKRKNKHEDGTATLKGINAGFTSAKSARQIPSIPTSPLMSLYERRQLFDVHFSRLINYRFLALPRVKGNKYEARDVTDQLTKDKVVDTKIMKEAQEIGT
jgi:hypothetical protein